MNITVCKQDLKNMGHTLWNEDGYVSIIQSTGGCGVEYILVREILKCFGKKYKVKSIDDFKLDDEGYMVTDENIQTNLPWEIYQEWLHTEPDEQDQTERPVEIKKTDITFIGNTIFQDEGGRTRFLIDTECCFWEASFLEKILKCFGDYKIINRYYFPDAEVHSDNICYDTNLPFDMYMSIQPSAAI